MSSGSSISQPPISGSTPALDYDAGDSYAQWLRVLRYGVIATLLGTSLAAVWSYLQFSARVSGFPDPRVLGGWFSVLTLGSSAINWVGCWLITSRCPLYNPEYDRTAAARWNNARGTTLRLLASGVFVIWSLRLFGLFGVPARPGFNEVLFWLTAQSVETLSIILFWAHLRAIAWRLDLPKLRPRATLVLLGRGATLLTLGVGPTLWSAVVASPMPLSWDFLNIRNLLYVLWAAIAMLVLVRFAAALNKQRA